MRADLRLHRPRTVRSTVTLLAAAIVAAVLVVSAVALVATQQRVLTHGIDESLRQGADNVAGALSAGPVGPVLPGEGDPEDTFLQLVGPDGSVLASTENAVGFTAVAGPLAPSAGQRITSVDDVPLDSTEFRVLARPVETTAGPGTLVVAKNLDDVAESVRILATSLLVAIPVATALLALVLWWLTGRVLRPVEAIREEVDGIGGDELHRRVPAPTGEDEISRLARTMNQMLDRVQQATERQRRFVADASHELRGPLTSIRSALEVGLAHPDTVDQTALQHSVLADTVDLQQLVDDLLFLARAESGALDGTGEPVDLDDLVLAEARVLRERGRVRVDTSAVSAARTWGDPHQLTRAVRNLAGNAERYATSTVRFELREQNGRSELVVADDGPGIPVEHHTTVFKRFTRLDQARSRDAGGAGLGLAIVQDIAVRHDGTVTIEADRNGTTDAAGARFVVRLPRVD